MLLVGLMDRDGEKKAFVTSVAAYQVPGDVFIYPSNETKSATAATIRVTTWLRLRESTVILQDPSFLGMWESLPLIFQVLDGCTNPCITFRNVGFLLVTIFLVRGSSSGLCLAFLTIIALSPQVREPLWGFCLLLSVSIPIVHSRAGERTTEQVQGPTVRRVRPELKLS